MTIKKAERVLLHLEDIRNYLVENIQEFKLAQRNIIKNRTLELFNKKIKREQKNIEKEIKNMRRSK